MFILRCCRLDSTPGLVWQSSLLTEPASLQVTPPHRSGMLLEVTEPEPAFQRYLAAGLGDSLERTDEQIAGRGKHRSGVRDVDRVCCAGNGELANVQDADSSDVEEGAVSDVHVRRSGQTGSHICDFLPTPPSRLLNTAI